MTRGGISTVLVPVLAALLVALNAPAVGADAPCIVDNAGNCVAAPVRDVTTQQIAEFDALSATAPGVAIASSGPVEDDQIRTALEMAGAATTAPIAAYTSGPASEHARMTAASGNS